jgi:hypothetical protein
MLLRGILKRPAYLFMQRRFSFESSLFAAAAAGVVAVAVEAASAYSFLAWQKEGEQTSWLKSR